MLIKILGGIAALIALLAVVIAMRPSDFKVERSVQVNAAADAPFRYVNDLHEMQRWNPWAQIDPNMTTEFSGPPSGVGAVYAWQGDSSVGKGKQTIVESIPGKKVAMKLEFFEPMQATNDVVFAFDESAGKTNVTWRMTGTQNFFMKGMSLFMNMDKMVGDEFTKGLTALKSLVESNPQAAQAS